MSEKGGSVVEFGRELINARNYKGLTLEQISEITKIAARYLQAMENGQWDLLPQPYMEAFLKSYAQTVGMNVPKVMKKYREMVLSELISIGEVEPRANFESLEVRKAADEPPQSLFSVKLKIYGVVVALVFVLLLVSLIRSCSTGGDSSVQLVPGEAEDSAAQSSAGTLTGREAPAQQEKSSLLEQPGPTSPASPEQRRVSTSIDLQARASETCWLLATIDQEDIRDVLLAPGDTINLQATREIHIVVGNAGGLDLTLGGQSLGSLGPQEKPVTVVIGPDGIISQRLGAWQTDYESEIVPGDMVN